MPAAQSIDRSKMKWIHHVWIPIIATLTNANGFLIYSFCWWNLSWGSPKTVSSRVACADRASSPSHSDWAARLTQSSRWFHRRWTHLPDHLEKDGGKTPVATEMYTLKELPHIQSLALDRKSLGVGDLYNHSQYSMFPNTRGFYSDPQGDIEVEIITTVDRDKAVARLQIPDADDANLSDESLQSLDGLQQPTELTTFAFQSSGHPTDINEVAKPSSRSHMEHGMDYTQLSGEETSQLDTSSHKRESGYIQGDAFVSPGFHLARSNPVLAEPLPVFEANNISLYPIFKTKKPVEAALMVGSAEISRQAMLYCKKHKLECNEQTAMQSILRFVTQKSPLAHLMHQVSSSLDAVEVN